MKKHYTKEQRRQDKYRYWSWSTVSITTNKQHGLLIYADVSSQFCEITEKREGITHGRVTKYDRRGQIKNILFNNGEVHNRQMKYITDPSQAYYPDIRQQIPTSTRSDKKSLLQMFESKSVAKVSKHTAFSNYNASTVAKQDVHSTLKLNYTISEVATPSEVAIEGSVANAIQQNNFFQLPQPSTNRYKRQTSLNSQLIQKIGHTPASTGDFKGLKQANQTQRVSMKSYATADYHTKSKVSNQQLNRSSISKKNNK